MARIPRRLVPVLVGALIALAPIPVAAKSRPAVVLEDRPVSRYTLETPHDCAPGATTVDCVQRDTEVEPSIAVNPEDPLNAVAAFQQGRVDGGGAAANGWAATFDGGRTWRAGQVPGITRVAGGPFDLASDPVVAFGPDDTVYINSLLFNRSGGRRALAVNVSHDGGRTWDPPSFVTDDSLGGTDKNWMTVDTGTGPGHHPGRVYVVWDRIAPVSGSYSDDQGRTWHSFQGVGSTIYPGQGIGALPLVLPNGDLAVVFSTLAYPLPPVHSNPSDIVAEPHARPGRFVIAVAPKAGSVPTGAPIVFAPPVTVGVYDGRPVRGQRAGDGLPAAAVDDRTGRIYVVWDDSRFRSDDVTDIVITWSDDGGLTWSPARRVNRGATDDYLNRFTPMIGVGPAGDVRVAYRVRQEKPGNDVTLFSPFVDTHLQVSTDGGMTFGAPLRVNSIRSDVRFAALSRDGAFLGDYNQLAIAGDTTYIVRTEARRESVSEAAYSPPLFHHQRAWVAVVGPEPAAREPRVLGETRRRPLPATGTAAAFLPAAAMLAGSIAGARVLRRAR